jgi:23S rRNA (cytosine1962-C5)-methyltransferase
MATLTPLKNNNYELLDTGDGFRLEKWGEYVLQRPDPQIIWQRHLSDEVWDKADAIFEGKGETGTWIKNNPINEPWEVNFGDITLLARLTPFKHTGIFAEQAANWGWLTNQVKNFTSNDGGKPKILNLFAYTGGASIALAKSGCFVTHVDASKPSIGWAKENQVLNKIPADSIRWILDDAIKFVTREIKRGAQYDGIIMDPPAFGHSPTGKTWKFNQDLPYLLELCNKILSPTAKFVLVNGYATNSSAIALNNLTEDIFQNRHGQIECGELCLTQQDKRLISTGIFARWSS